MAAVKNLGANRGDLAEAVIGAAVTARFWLKPEGRQVTEADLKKVLDSFLRSNPTTFQRDDLNVVTRITDEITFRVGIPKVAYDFIRKRENWSLIPELFKSSVAYVNADRRLILQSNILAKNGKIDKILVDADGTGDQTGTKADIKLSVNGKPTPQQISLKVKGGDQFAQVGGLGFEKQTEIWTNRLGIDITRSKAEFDRIYNQINNKLRFADRTAAATSKEAELSRKAAGVVYEYAAEQLQTKFKRIDSALINRIGDFIVEGATKTDPSIELVKLVGGSFVKARFGKKFRENMMGAAPNLRVEFKGTTADPTVIIYDKDLGPGKKGKLFQVRARYSGEGVKNKQGKYYKVYIRNIVEAGDLLFQLATDK